MFIADAYAQTASGMGGSLNAVVQFAPLILIVVIFYFLLIRPQQQQQKNLKAQLAALKRGDRVVTGGGIIGMVKKTSEGSDEVEVEIAPNVSVNVVRSTITSVVQPTATKDKPKS